MTSAPHLRCLPGGLSDRLPPAWLSLASGDADADLLALGHEDRLALAAHLLAGVHGGDLRPEVALRLVDGLLDRRPKA